MNLFEIILSLVGLNRIERERELNNIGVDKALHSHIHDCFNDENRLISAADGKWLGLIPKR